MQLRVQLPCPALPWQVTDLIQVAAAHRPCLILVQDVDLLLPAVIDPCLII